MMFSLCLLIKNSKEEWEKVGKSNLKANHNNDDRWGMAERRCYWLAKKSFLGTQDVSIISPWPRRRSFDIFQEGLRHSGQQRAVNVSAFCRCYMSCSQMGPPLIFNLHMHLLSHYLGVSFFILLPRASLCDLRGSHTLHLSFWIVISPNAGFL